MRQTAIARHVDLTPNDAGLSLLLPIRRHTAPAGGFEGVAQDELTLSGSPGTETCAGRPAVRG